MRAERLEVRLTPEEKALVARAAELKGMSLSAFVVRVCQKVAERTVERLNIKRLTLRDQETLVQALLNPPKPNAALKKALSGYKSRYRLSH